MYENRYVAFLDILGFSELIRRLDKESSLLDKILDTLRAAEQFRPLVSAMNETKDGQDFWRGMIRVAAFSDSVVISTKENSIGLSLIVISTTMLSAQLLGLGIFARGSICLGKLYHEESVLFGMGLIDAYNLESKAAVYPRILIQDQLAQPITQIFQGQKWPHPLRRDFDGLWHLDLFNPKLAEIIRGPVKPGEVPKPTYLAAARSAIQVELARKHEPPIYAKIRWLANYFNQNATSSGEPSIPL